MSDLLDRPVRPRHQPDLADHHRAQHHQRQDAGPTPSASCRNCSAPLRHATDPQYARKVAQIARQMQTYQAVAAAGTPPLG